MEPKEKQPTAAEIDTYWWEACDLTEKKLIESMRNDPAALMEYQNNVIERLGEENEKLRIGNTKWEEMFTTAKKVYAEKGHEEAVRFLKLGRGKHGRKAGPFDIIKDYVNCLKNGCPRIEAIKFVRNLYGLQGTEESSIKYLWRALAVVKKYSKNPDIYKGLLPGNPTPTTRNK
jgi:hypothetical protein